MKREFEKKGITTGRIVRAGLIASIYCVMVLVFAPLSYGPIQVRIAEALTLLPYLWVEAIPGLFVGCVIANFAGGFGIADVIFGSFATLVAAWITGKMPNVYLAALPPVVVNMLVVGAMLSVVLELPFYSTALYVGAGQAVACFGLGVPLAIYIEKKAGKKRI